MPLSPLEKEQYVKLKGYDPTKFTVDDNTVEIVPLEAESMATPSGAIPLGVNPILSSLNAKGSQQGNYSVGGTIGRNAALGVVPAASGFMAGAGASALASAPLEMVPPPFGQILHGLTALGGGLIGAYGAGKAQEAILNRTDVGKQFMEETAQANAEHPIAAVGGNLVGSLPFARFNPTLLRDMGRVASTGDSLLGGVGKAISSPAGLNVALGAGVGAGQGIYDEIQDPNELNIGRLGLNIAGGALINDPRKFMSKVGVKGYTSPRSVVDTGLVAPRPEAPRAPDMMVEPPVPEIKVKPGAVDIQGDYPITKIPYTGEVEPNLKKLQIEQAYAERNKQILDEQRATKARLDEIEATKLAQENVTRATELQESLTKNQTKNVVPPIIKPFVESQGGLETSIPKNDYTGNMADDAIVNARESASDLEMRRLEGNTGDKYSKTEQSSILNESLKGDYRTKTPEEQAIIAQRMRSANELTAKRQDVRLETDTSGKPIKDSSGKLVKGVFSPKENLARISEITPDTGGHEFTHKIWSMLPENFKRRLEAIVNKEKSSLEPGNKVREWFESEHKQGNMVDSEEALGQLTGQMFANRVINRDSSLRRDLTAWFRVHVSKSATTSDVARFLTNKLVYGDAPPKGSVRSGIVNQTAEEKGQPSNQESITRNYLTGIVDSNDSVKSVEHGSDKAGSSHRGLGFEEPTGRWRYIPSKNRVDWTDTPTLDKIHAVENHLAKKDIYPDKHMSYIGNETYLDNTTKSQPLEQSSFDEGKSLYDDTQLKLRAAMKTGDIESPEFQALWKQNEEIKNKYFEGHTPESYTQKLAKGEKLQEFEQAPLEITSEDFELKPNLIKNLGIKAVAIKVGDKIISGKEGEPINHALLHEREGFPKDAISGFIDKNGKFIPQYNDTSELYQGVEQQPIVEKEVTNKALLKATLPKDYTANEETLKSLETADKLGKARDFDEAIYESTATKQEESKDKYWAMKEQLGGDASRNQDARQQQIESPEFKKWFGDSKVVDKEGKPLVVYHGTNKDFTEFRTNHLNYGNESHNWFTTSPDMANSYTRGQGNVKPVFLSLKNLATEKQYNENSTLKLIKQGYDGVKFDKGGRHDVDTYIAFNPTDIKSAIGNKGTFDSTNPDIRYQPTEQQPIDSDIDNSSKGFLKYIEPTFDSVERVSKTVAEAFRKWAVEKRQLLGMKNVTLKELESFDRDEINAVGAKRRSAFRDEVTPVFNGNEAEINDILTSYYKPLREKQIEAGLEIEGRKAGINENYIPDSLSDRAIDTLVNKSQTVEARSMRREWAEHIVNGSDGKIPLAMATDYVDKYIRALGGSDNDYRSIHFGALRKAQGFGLPESMREVDVIRSLDKYGRRAANDLAMFKELESKPEIAAALDIPNPNTGEIPIIEGVEKLTGTEVQNAMKWVTGSYASHHPLVNSFVRTVTNGLLGPATGIRDLISAPSQMLPYMHQFSDVGAFFKGITKVRENSAKALETGARQPSIDKIAYNQVLDNPTPATALLNKVATGLRKYQGREAIENLSRDIVFSVGRELVKNNIIGALNNKQRSVEFLKKFSTAIDGDITTLTGDKLESAIDKMAANFVDRNQGTYDGRGLPIGMVDSTLAPFFSLQKWSVEKSNVIYQDVVKPFVTGENRLPALTYTLGTILTGAAIQELNKALTGRKPQDPDLKESLAFKHDPAVVASELATIMQLGSFAGIVSDGVKALSDIALKGKAPRNIVSFPAATMLADLRDKTTDFAEALHQGDDPWNSLKMFATDMITHNVQAARIANNYTLNKDEIERSDKYRDLRVFKELSGEPVGEPTKSNKYLNSEARKFKQTSDINEAVGYLPALLRKFTEKVKENPDKAMSFLRGLRANNFQTVPNPESMPQEFIKYWNFLKKTQGEENAKKRIQDYFRQNAINSAKSEMIPSL